MTDAQIDALIATVAGSGQDVPLNETARPQAGERRLEDLRDAARARLATTAPSSEHLFGFALIR